MPNRRERYLRRDAERKARKTQPPVVRPPDAIPDARSQAGPESISGEPQPVDHDADYAAYLASLADDSEHARFLSSLGDPPEQRPAKEKITWHRNHKPTDNWHDYLVCRCGTCTSFRKVNGIKWDGEAGLWADPGQPDPWDDSGLRGDTESLGCRIDTES